MAVYYKNAIIAKLIQVDNMTLEETKFGHKPYKNWTSYMELIDSDAIKKANELTTIDWIMPDSVVQEL